MRKYFFKKNNVNSQQQHRFRFVITIHICNCTAAADGKLNPEGGRCEETDSSVWWWIAKRVCVCVCMPNKTHPSYEWAFFQRSSKETVYSWVPFKSKVSLKLIQSDGKALTGCWCDRVFLFKAITESLHKENWFSSTNRLRIMPRGLVTVALDCTPVENTSALVVCV